MKYYVNASSSRDGNGSAEMPFKHIQDAADIAMPGPFAKAAGKYVIQR